MNADSEPGPSSEKVALTVNLAGIIKIFGQSLYNEFGAIVRELVQNGHDACLEGFAAAGPGAALRDSWVNVRYDSVARTLVVADNGTGMNQEDAEHSLNNFGGGKKDEAREAVAALSPEQPLYIIGLYGVGFLSALAVSETVEVWTRQAGCSPIVWSYRTGQTVAEVRDVPVDEFATLRRKHGLRAGDPGELTGTIVVCRVDAEVEEEYRVAPEVIRAALLKYVRLLRVPVFFNGERINDQSVAWANPARASVEDWREAVREWTGATPLLVIPVYSPPAELDLEGVLWIPERKKILGDNGHIDLYVRRMFVTQDAHLIRPVWARFVLGVVNSNKLGRIVSGNTVIEDSQVGPAREFVKNCILDAFDRLYDLPEADYWRVVGEHDDIIKVSAAEDDEFLDRVWDKLRVRARGERLTVPQYLDKVEARTGRRDAVYYYSKTVQEFSAGVVADAARIPVLSMWTLNDDEFVRRVCARRNLELLSYSKLAADVFTRPADDGPYQSLIAACAALKVAADVREFDPPHLPAILIEDEDLKSRRAAILGVLQSGSAVDQKLAGAFQSLSFRDGAVNRDVSFYLNALNPLVQKLRAAPFPTQQAICRAIYNIAYMAIVPQLDRSEVQAINTSIESVLMTMLDQMLPPPPPPPPPCKPTRLFVIAPFNAAYRGVEEAVREVFEGPPYFFEVVLARDFMHEGRLLDDLLAHMGAADGFVAEITDLNPNVMLELGSVALRAPRDRPVLLLRAETAQPVPADLAGELYIGYGAATDPPAQTAAAIRARLAGPDGRSTHRDVARLRDARNCRALNARLLESRCTDDEQRRLRNHYPTVEALLWADPIAAERTAGVSADVIEFVQKHLRKLGDKPADAPLANPPGE